MAMVVRMGWERVVEKVFYSDMESAVSIASTEITMMQKIDDSCVLWLVCLCSFVQSRLWRRQASTVITRNHRRTLNSSAISRRQVKQINHRACNACFTSFRNLMQSNMRWPHVVCSCIVFQILMRQRQCVNSHDTHRTIVFGVHTILIVIM